MKPFFKTKNLLILIMVVSSIVSCDKTIHETVHDSLEPHPHLSITSSSLENISDNANLTSVLKGIQENLLIQGRNEKDGDNFFHIDTQSIKVISTGTYSSYTFRIVRSEYPDLFENLVISEFSGEFRSMIISYKLTPEQLLQVQNDLDIVGEYQMKAEQIQLSLGDIVSKQICVAQYVQAYHKNKWGDNWRYDGPGSCPHENEGDFDFCETFYVVNTVTIPCPEVIEQGDSGGSGGESNNGGGWTSINGNLSNDPLSGSGENPLSGTGLSDVDGDDVLTVTSAGSIGTPSTIAAQLNLNQSQSQFLGSEIGMVAFLSIFDFLDDYGHSEASEKAARKALTNLLRGTDLNSLSTQEENELYAEISSILLNIYSGLIFPESTQTIDALKQDDQFRVSQNLEPILELKDWEFISERKTNALRELKYSPTQKDFFFDNSNLENITKEETEVSLLSPIKQMLGKYWPNNGEEWGALMELMSPMLLEIGIEFLPFGGAFNSGKDTLAGLSSGDYGQAVVGIVGIIMEFVPWTKLAKIAHKIYKVGKKIFAVFEAVYKYLTPVVASIKAGYSAVSSLGSVLLKDSAGNTVAKFSDDVVEIITEKGLRLVDPDGLKLLNKITPSNSGFISKSKLSNASKFKPSQSGLKADFDNLKNLDNNQLGQQSEVLADKLFEQNQYASYDAKIPGFDGNNGFDGVYIKKDANGNVQDILINEVKQVSSSGTIQLNSANLQTGLPRQMSRDWINDVLDRMRESNNSQAVRDLANLILANEAKITKVVTGIDKHSDQILVFPIN